MTIWRWILNDPRSQDHNHGMEYLFLWSHESPELIEVDHMDHFESEYKLSKKTYNWSWLWGVVCKLITISIGVSKWVISKVVSLLLCCFLFGRQSVVVVSWTLQKWAKWEEDEEKFLHFKVSKVCTSYHRSGCCHRRKLWKMTKATLREPPKTHRTMMILPERSPMGGKKFGQHIKTEVESV